MPDNQSINSTPTLKKTFWATFRRLFFLLLFYPFIALGDITQPQSLATATAATTQAIINQVTTLTSDHFVFIYNNNFFVNPYVYSFSLCPALQPCTGHSAVIYLQPHQGINISWSLVNNVLYTNPNTYPIVATSSIVGSDLNITVTGNSVINVIQPFQVIQTKATA